MTRLERQYVRARVALAAEDWERSREPQDCPQLLAELERFYDDPYTIAYGMGSEMSPLVIAGHKRRHGCAGLVE